jgi:hypothetical protein
VPEGEKATGAVAFMLADLKELAKVQPGSGKDLGGGAETAPPARRKTR